jgi:sugar phosphate isomerase/epimerase
MKIGAMNNPNANVYKELEWIGKNGFDYIDFTIEPTATMPEQLDVAKVKRLLKKYNLGIVGHMGDWKLAKESLYTSLRDVSRKEIIRAIRMHKKLGARKVTIHAPNFPDIEFKKARPIYKDLIKELLKEAKKQDIKLMFENGNNTKDHVRLIDALMRDFPALGLHIDVGHANLHVKKNMAFRYLKKYGKRVMHFHFSDNRGKGDNHKQLGAGNVPWAKVIEAIKKAGYDGTITCETFRSGKKGTIRSMKKLRKMWETV